MSTTSVRAAGGPHSYWRASRSHRYSLLFAIPLLLLYEALAALLATADGGLRNGADVLLKGAFIAVAGRYGPLLFGALLVALAVWLVGRDMRAHGPRLRLPVFVAMLAESAALALAFGIVVGGLTSQLLGRLGLLAMSPTEQMGWWTQLMVSLGAGLYEELLFRVVLVSALVAIARRVFHWRPWAAGTVATVVGALIFSAFHYVGPYGDQLELSSFVFRAIGGLVFSALFLLRGFGITAWTHALYDVFLLSMRG
jgi:hypothetical protein